MNFSSDAAFERSYIARIELPQYQRMIAPRQFLMFLTLGVFLTLVCAYVGELLTPPAIARWTLQSNEHDEFRAALAMIGVRHLPLFLLSVALGNVIFRMVRRTSLRAVATVAAPYVVYVMFRGVLESLDAGESAWSWVTYEPAYFIWPHFITVPAGLFAAARMVGRQKPISAK